MWTAIAASLITGTLVHFAHTIQKSKLKDQFDNARYQERVKNWSEGYDDGWLNRGLELIPYINEEHYQHMYGKPFTP